MKKKTEATGSGPKKEMDEERLKRSVIKARNNIRKKFRDLHNQRTSIGIAVSETYKPIIQPIKEMVNLQVKQEKMTKDDGNKFPWLKSDASPPGRKNIFTPDFKTALPVHRASRLDRHEISGVSSLQPEVTDDEDDDDEKLEDRLIKKVSSNSPAIDTTYGLRIRNNELYLGKHHVDIKNNGNKVVYTVNKKSFTSTPGLDDLLVLKDPKTYTQTDLLKYRNMLEHTGAHLTNNIINRQPKLTKYTNVIANLFPVRPIRAHSATNEKETSKRGGDLQLKYKIANKGGRVDYAYWDDPNELVDRLRVLTASKAAGHTGHDNEIISIIEELREAGIIK